MELYKYIIAEDLIMLAEASEGKLVSTNEPDAVKKIRSNCSHYLGLLRGRDPLVRGMKIYVGEGGLGVLWKRQVRQDRQSRMASLDKSKLINEFLERFGHVRRDHALIASSKGRVEFKPWYRIYPIGRFDYTWVRSSDWNYSEGKWPGNMILHGEFDEVLKVLEDQDGVGNIVSNKRFGVAYDKKYEIWMGCKEYYFTEYDRKII
jgi:hypothetical protein